MKQGLATELAPSPSVVYPHFIFSTLAFLFLAIFTILAGNELTAPYFAGKTLALTHFATLGWISMAIFGALYQLIPVVMEVALYSEKLAKTTFVLFAIGIILLIYDFWMNDFGVILITASTLLLTAILMFSFNIVMTAKATKKWNIESSLIISSVTWLSTTAILGFLISINFKYPFLSTVHLEYLKAHSHTGMVGWFMLLIIGVGAVLLPMFFLSHNLDRRRLNWAFYLINSGLLLFFIDTVFVHVNIFIVPAILIAAGVFSFMLYVHQSYKKRVRKVLDIPMKHSVVSIVLLFLPMLLAFFISLAKNVPFGIMNRIIILYGVSILIGFIASLILGQAYKTLPFIIWLHKYQDYVGKYRTPLPKDIYSEKILDWQYWAYLATVITLFSGLISGFDWLIQIGTYLLLLTAILYNFNIYKMFTHKVKQENLQKL